MFWHVFSTMWLVLGLEFFAAIEVSVGVYVMWNKHVGYLVFVHLTSQSSEEKEAIGTAIEFRSVKKWLDITRKRKMIDRGSIRRNPTILLKWKTLPPKHEKLGTLLLPLMCLWS